MERRHHLVLHTASVEDTERLGTDIAGRIDAGLCVCLVGPLGAGKTALVRGLCRGLGVDEDVLSPTFILFEEFEGRLPVVHVDLYRLEHETELEALGVFDLIGSHRVLLAEWGDRSDALLDAADVVVTISYEGESSRRFDVEYADSASAVFEGVESWS